MTHQPNRFPISDPDTPEYAYAQSGVFHTHEEHGLKSLSEEELVQNLFEAGDDWTEIEATMVADAYRLGQAVHHEDSHRDLPYVYHLLRNANRISEYAHIHDAEILAGAILHDAVEDHPEELAAWSGLEVPEDEQGRREMAFKFIRERFSERVAAMVDGMTNPLPEVDSQMDYYQKIQAYVEHIAVAIRNTDVFFGKWADWSDNGVGIRHSDNLKPEQAGHFTYKYGQVLPVLEARFYEDDIQAMLDPVAKANILRSFQLARQRLTVSE